MAEDIGPSEEEVPGEREEKPAGVGTEGLLRRSLDDRVVAGVAGGLGRYLGVDPILVRIAFVLLTVFGGGSGILLYVVGWLVIPEQRSGEEIAAAAPKVSGNAGRLILGTVLLLVGAAMLLGPLLPRIGRFVAPLVLIGAGLAVLLANRR